LWRAPAAWRVALVLAIVGLVLSRADDVRAQPPDPSTLSLTSNSPRGVEQAQPVNYHIHGDATVVYDYSSAEGQAYLATCNVEMVPKWHLTLDGTLDSVGQTLKGIFEFNAAPTDQWQQWDSNVLQCGPEMHGQTSCATDCGPYWVTYKYNAAILGGTFQGTYANGHVEILGSAHFAAQFIFQDCANMDTGVGMPCETALGFTPTTVPPQSGLYQGLPSNAKVKTFDYGIHPVNIAGSIILDEGGVSIHANMNLPESQWASCCIVSDPLFLSDKNHVSITGEPTSPG